MTSGPAERRTEYEYRIVQKNGIPATGIPVILDVGLARAFCVTRDYQYPALGPHTIECREWRDNEWEPVA